MDKSFSKKIGAFSSATLISRILGYVRDAMVASYFGGGLKTDAFYAAIKIPNLLRRFLGEGSLTAAFVPVFTETLHKKNKEDAQNLFNSIFTGLILLTTVLTILAIVFASPLTHLVSWGFVRSPEKFDLTVTLTRLSFPFLIFVTGAALFTALLNSCGIFFIPAVAPSGLSIAEIAFILLFTQFFSNPIEGLAISAVVGVAIHMFWQLPGFYKQGYKLRFIHPLSHPEVKTVFILMIPTVIGLCSDQINSFVDQFCASFLQEGSISALYNSNRIMQLPLALFGVAVSSVALPALSKSAAIEDEKYFKSLLNFSLRIANFVLIPSLMGLVVLGLPIVQALFERGHFLPEHSLLTYQALAPYALGLPAYSATKILATAFYAKKNTTTPVKLSFLSMVINVVLNFLLMKKLGVGGLALASAVVAWLHAILLYLYLRKSIGPIGGREIGKSFFFGILAGCGMSIISWAVCFKFLVSFHPAIKVFGGISAGTAFYFFLAKAFKVPEYDFFIEALTHRNIKLTDEQRPT